MEFDSYTVIIGTIVGGLIALVAFMALPQPEKKKKSTGGGGLKPRGQYWPSDAGLPSIRLTVWLDSCDAEDLYAQ
jgi:hypothetical protein